MKKLFFCLVVVILMFVFAACGEATTDATAADAPTTPTVDTEHSTDFFAEELRNGRDYLLVVNDDHPYVFDSLYNIALQKDIVYLADYDYVAQPIEKATQVAFTQMMEDLQENYGIEIGLVSAYRDETEQELICEGYYTNLPKGKLEYTEDIGPGYSEHHTGLLVLFAIKKGGKKWTMNPELRESKKYSVIWDNLADYGFIERYPQDKENVTEVDYNPYEIRFVGSTEVAKNIRDEGLCLEQFVFFEEHDRDSE